MSTSESQRLLSVIDRLPEFEWKARHLQDVFDIFGQDTHDILLSELRAGSIGIEHCFDPDKYLDHEDEDYTNPISFVPTADGAAYYAALRQSMTSRSAILDLIANSRMSTPSLGFDLEAINGKFHNLRDIEPVIREKLIAAVTSGAVELSHADPSEDPPMIRFRMTGREPSVPTEITAPAPAPAPVPTPERKATFDVDAIPVEVSKGAVFLGNPIPDYCTKALETAFPGRVFTVRLLEYGPKNGRDTVAIVDGRAVSLRVLYGAASSPDSVLVSLLRTILSRPLST